MKNTITKFGKLLSLMTLVVATLGVMSLPATAHVGVGPNTAEQGSFGVFNFKVPNEETDANTVKLEVAIPVDAHMGYVSVQPKAGWTYEVEKTKLDPPVKGKHGEIKEVVSKITWSGGEIKPGEFDQFTVSMGVLPSTVDSISFKTIQTYSNGVISRWIDEPLADGKEAEHPAPVLTLTKASSDDAMASTHDAKNEKKSADNSDDSDDDDSDDESSSNTVGYVGIGLGAVALLAAIAAFSKKNK